MRPLTAEDVPEWRRLRRRMLVEHPTAFLEHPDDFSGRDDAEVAGRLAEGNVVGVFLDGTMVGSGGFFADRASKRRHVATIWGMYLAPEARSLGAGRALLDDLLERLAVAGTEVAVLDVAEDNDAARHLYQSAGFETWGREPDAMRVEGRSITLLHMRCRLGV